MLKGLGVLSWVCKMYIEVLQMQKWTISTNRAQQTVGEKKWGHLSIYDAYFQSYGH